MSDAPVVHIGENSPEQVALKLLGAVAKADGKKISAYGILSGDQPADRKYILDTYAECLHAVRGYRNFQQS